MGVCVMSEDEAWFIERGETIPDHGIHRHWNTAKAIRELNAGRVRLAVVPNTVVLLPVLSPAKEDRGYATDWHPRMSAGCPVWQLSTEE